jgi:hypothetical protein
VTALDATASEPTVPQRLNDLLFEPRSVAPMAVFRMALGALVTVWTISIGADVLHFFGPDALAPRASGRGLWTILGSDPSNQLVLGVYATLLVSAIAVIVGWHTRIASLLMLLALISFSRRDPWVYNSGDAMLRILAFYLVLMPAGEAYALDARRRHGDWRFVARRAPWPLWLVRIQLAIIYITTAIEKLPGASWTDGTAVGTALRIADLQRFPVPAFFTESLVLVNLITFGTIAFEIVAGVLIWPKATRRYVIMVGIGLHLGIEYALQVGPFSWAMLVAYLSFASADAIEDWVGRRFGRPHAQDDDSTEDTGPPLDPVHPEVPADAV